MSEYIPIGQPNAGTLSKIAKLRPSTVIGDRKLLQDCFSLPVYLIYCLYTAIDAIIVGIETQDEYLASKKTWTRKMVLITDGENPMEIEDWEATVKKMNALDIITTIVYAVARFPVMHWNFDCLPVASTLTTLISLLKRRTNQT